MIELTIDVAEKSKDHVFANMGHPETYVVDGKQYTSPKKPLLRFKQGEKYKLLINGRENHPFYFSAIRKGDTRSNSDPGGSINDKQNIMQELIENNVMEVDAPVGSVVQARAPSKAFSLLSGTLTIDLSDKKAFNFIKETYEKVSYNCAFHRLMGGPVDFVAVSTQSSGVKTKMTPTLSLEPATRKDFLNLSFDRPIALTSTRSCPDDLFIAEQLGVVWRVDVETSQKTMFLDISRLVKRLNISSAQDERGLLDIGFPPDFPNRPEVFIYYSTAANSELRPKINHYGCLSVFQVDVDAKRAIDGTTADGRPNSEQVLLRVEEPYANHNGGRFVFGQTAEDRSMIYLGLGDGGLANDPENRSQNLENVHGKILRIDYTKGRTERQRGPDGSELRSRLYAIPPSNPFAQRSDSTDDSSKILGEIYAYGLRNPWGLSWTDFNSLVVADVGQNDREELNIVKIGKNYGWPLIEGSKVTEKGKEVGLRQGMELSSKSSAQIVGRKMVSDSSTKGLFDAPIYEYDNTGGNSIIGGYHFPGTRKYVCGDYQSQLMLLDMSDKSQWTLLQKVRLSPSRFVRAFGRDWRGQIYVLTRRPESDAVSLRQTKRSDKDENLQGAMGLGQVFRVTLK